MSSRQKKYTDKQKIAYYKKMALQGKGAYYAPSRVSRARQVYGGAKLSGRGAYKEKASGGGSVARPISTAAGTAIGAAIGSLFGPGPGTAIGGALGGLGGNALGNIMGWGAYDVKRNSVWKQISEGNEPARMHTSKSDLVVAHREYITDIISSASANTFQSQVFPINPGLIQSFPWLAPIAQQFEQYEILGMVFEFKSLSADAISNTTNTALGYVVMATEYNSILTNVEGSNAPFPNKQAMENAEYSTSLKPSLSAYHAVECDPGQNPLQKLYIRSGAVPSGSDARMYDLGLFQISTSCPGTSVVLGELWVSYEIRMRKPISTSSIAQDVLTDHFALGTVTNAAPLGTTSAAKANSSIGGTIDATGTIYSFPPVFQAGSYLVVYNVQGTAASIVHPVVTTTNCTKFQLFNGNTLNTPHIPADGVSSAFFECHFVITLTGLNASFTFGAGTLPSAFTNGDLVVTQWDGDVST